MKHLLQITIAAVVLVGCATTQQPEPPTAKAPDISIHKAAVDGNIEAVKQHIAAGTDVNAKGVNGWTPLRFAANKKVAELLLANGADVNTKDTNGWTPLHQAAFKGHKGATSLFIANGAEVNAKVVSGPYQGSTPLDAANENNHPETADLLRKHGGKTGEELKAEGK